MLDCTLCDGGRCRPAQYQRADRLAHDQYFVDTHSALVTQLTAFLAADAPIELRRLDLVLRKTNFPQVVPLDFVLRLAMGTNRAHQTLRHDGLDRGRYQKRLDA